MNRLLFTLSLTIAYSAATAQDTLSLPPDYYGEALREAYVAWENTGWVHNTAGNLEPYIRYVTEGAVPRAYIKKSGVFSLVLSSIDTLPSTLDTLRRLDIAFDGPHAQYPDPIVQLQRDYHKNFHFPWCGPAGRTMVKGYRWIMYPNIYPFIDMYLYCGQRGQKMMFVVRPTGDPANLTMTFSGHSSMDIDVLGNLKLLLEDKWVTLPEAVAYQYDTLNNIHSVDWTAQYTADISSGEVGFQFGDYDRYKPLVLLIGPPPAMGGPQSTPGLCWSTFFGGDAADQIQASCFDTNDNYYVTGNTYSSFATFPNLLGTNIFSGAPSLYVSQLDGNDALRWSTYFGGSGASQVAFGVTAKHGTTPDVYVCGVTSCTNFTCMPESNAYYDSTGTAPSAFVSKFENGEGGMLWSTYLGSDDFIAYACEVDYNNRLIVVGLAQNGTLPAEYAPPPSSFEHWPLQSQDGFIALFDEQDRLYWYTPYGGDDLDYIRSVRATGTGFTIYGITRSDSIPTVCPPGGYCQNNHGASDVFITQFGSNGSLVYATQLGGSGDEVPSIHGLDVDPADLDVYVAGASGGAGFPLVSDGGWYDTTLFTVQTTQRSGFVTQFDSETKQIVWSTYVGWSYDDFPMAIDALRHGSVVLVGSTKASIADALPADGLYYSDSLHGPIDGFIFVVDDAHQLSYLTQCGGDSADQYLTGVVKVDGILYCAGNTQSPEEALGHFPLTNPQNGAWFSGELQPSTDAFLQKLCLNFETVGLVEPTGLAAQTQLAYGNGYVLVPAAGMAGGTPERLRLLDCLGRTLAVVTAEVTGPTTISTAALNAGTYLIQGSGPQRCFKFAIVR